MANREFTASSGNVFADLKLPHADDLLAKAELAALGDHPKPAIEGHLKTGQR
jgi:hypothetical protein